MLRAGDVDPFPHADEESQQIFEVAWLDGAHVSEGVARVHQDDVRRWQPPLTQQLVTAWIQDNAHAQPLQVPRSRCINADACNH